MNDLDITKFEKTMQDYAQWDGESEAPAYPIYNGGVVALVDRFPKFPGQVVIFPKKGFPGENVGLYDLPTNEHLAVDLVSHVIGKQMQSLFQGVKIVRHDEGYAIPDHPHTVLFPAARGEGKKLYEPSTLSPSIDYFKILQEFLALDCRQTELLDRGLAKFMLDATLIDPLSKVLKQLPDNISS